MEQDGGLFQGEFTSSFIHSRPLQQFSKGTRQTGLIAQLRSSSKLAIFSVYVVGSEVVETSNTQILDGERMPAKIAGHWQVYTHSLHLISLINDLLTFPLAKMFLSQILPHCCMSSIAVKVQTDLKTTDCIEFPQNSYNYIMVCKIFSSIL